jgi:hypothetical protein
MSTGPGTGAGTAPDTIADLGVHDRQLLSWFPPGKIAAVTALIEAGARWDDALRAAQQATIGQRTDRPVTVPGTGVTVTFSTVTKDWITAQAGEQA